MAQLPLEQQSTTDADVRVVLRPEAWEGPSYLVVRKGGYEVIKRMIDVLGAVAGLIAASPLCVVIAILIKLNSPGPILFRQKRPGKHGRFFEILKFRTMEKNAEEKLDQIVDVHNTEDPLIRVEHDPRVTGVGHLLRVTSLDELPQLINVLKGEMSLVGPRPISRPIHDPRNALRLEVTPGLTGLWQVSGRKNENTDFMLRKDMEYLQRRSLTFDLLLLFRTVTAVVNGNGAR
jgi:lipopolysaccharide/colanic/teichoic acid biosynthesis glycosyltransferase